MLQKNIVVITWGADFAPMCVLPHFVMVAKVVLAVIVRFLCHGIAQIECHIHPLIYYKN